MVFGFEKKCLRFHVLRCSVFSKNAGNCRQSLVRSNSNDPKKIPPYTAVFSISHFTHKPSTIFLCHSKRSVLFPCEYSWTLCSSVQGAVLQLWCPPSPKKHLVQSKMKVAQHYAYSTLFAFMSSTTERNAVFILSWILHSNVQDLLFLFVCSPPAKKALCSFYNDCYTASERFVPLVVCPSPPKKFLLHCTINTTQQHAAQLLSSLCLSHPLTKHPISFYHDFYTATCSHSSGLNAFCPKGIPCSFYYATSTSFIFMASTTKEVSFFILSWIPNRSTPHSFSLSVLHHQGS